MKHKIYIDITYLSTYSQQAVAARWAAIA